MVVKRSRDVLRNWFLVTSGLWLVVSLLLLVSALFFNQLGLSWLFCGYLLISVAASLTSFVVFAYDKWRAKRQRGRISERSLHLLAWVGGWPGAVLARELFRHKTQKLTFRLLLPMIAAAHFSVLFLGFLLT